MDSYLTLQGRVAKMELAYRLFTQLFPSRCLLCQQTVVRSAVRPNIELCADCYHAQPFNLTCCVRCALPLAVDVDGHSGSGDGSKALCGRCITKLPAFDYSASLFRYEDDIVRLVHQLKFAEKITCARTIGELFLSEPHIVKMIEAERPDCLLPVPLHASRLRQRGFNQSIEIARVLAKKLALPIEYNAIIRQRKTGAQTGLDARQRRKNIKGAFAVKEKLAYRRVLIIDDVVTTGSTVNELARLLKRHKVERVGVLSIARAPIKN